MSSQHARTTKRPSVPRSTDPLIHDANRFLFSAVKSAWHLTRFVAGVAIRIPGWFVRANRHVAKKKADQTAR
ncbi:MAG TPA: hypothetical protein VG605_02650 [Puia sp.]|nr:hypothetical protein [Puia sp.]